jgi:ribonuclease J
MIEHVINTLTRAGADVVNNTILSDIHSSGHPSKQELRLVLKLFKPTYFMPMHGDHRMLLIHAQLASTVGVKPENCFVLDNGDSIVLSKHKISRGYAVYHGNTYIDGKDINGLAANVMEDRRILKDDGMLAITVSIDTKTNKIIVPPQLIARGMISEDKLTLMDACKTVVEKAIIEKLQTKTNFAELKAIIKEVAGQFIYAKTSQKPMIIPVIMAKN